jgi:hypothetical protein
VDVGGVDVVGRDARHRVRLVGGAARDWELGDVLTLQRQVIGRVAESQQSHCSFIRAERTGEWFGAQNHRGGAVGDLRAVADLERRGDARIGRRFRTRGFQRQCGVAHLGARVELRVQPAFQRHPREVVFGKAVPRFIKRRDPAEEFGEHELAVQRPLGVIIPGRPEHVRPVGGRHRLLLLDPRDQHHVVQSGHNLLRPGKHRGPPRGARGLHMHRRNPAHLRVDFGEKRPQVKLPREQSACEIPNHARTDRRRINPRAGNRLAAGLDQYVARALALLGEIPLEIRPRGADQINTLGHVQSSVGRYSSRHE